MAQSEDKATPKVQGGWLFTEQTSIKLDTPAWIMWLAGHTTFSFESDQGRCTARRRETRVGRHYWYAYRRHKHKLYKLYLGKAEELTNERLQTVASKLVERVGAEQG